MKLRKLFVVLLALLVVLSFAGCGGGGGGSDDDPSGGGGNGGGNGGNGGGEADTTPNYLCFTATGASTVSMIIAKGTVDPLPTLEYSTDGTTWEDFIIGDTEVGLAAGEKVYLRGDNTSFSTGFYDYLSFVMTGSIAASGNIMSLLDKSCESVTIPNVNCFGYLFKGCTALTAAPELPAEALEPYCYVYMFQGCSSLSSIRVHFSEWNISSYSTQDWVNGVAKSGTFECPSALPHADEDFDTSKVPKDSSDKWTVNTF